MKRLYNKDTISILGIDPGLSNTGLSLCYYNYNTEEFFIDKTTTIKTKATDGDQIYRSIIIVSSIKEFLSNYKAPNIIGIESPVAGFGHGGRVLTLPMLYGFINAWIYYNKDFMQASSQTTCLQIHNQTAKKTATQTLSTDILRSMRKDNKLKKRIVYEGLLANKNIIGTIPTNEHACDSVAIAYTTLNTIKDF